MERRIVPVLLGADLNCYNVARAFHESYGVKSYVLGRYAIGATKYSRMINFKSYPDLDNPERFVEILTDFAHEHKGEDLILMGCTDDYVSLVVHNKHLLTDYIISATEPEILDRITLKADFYALCDRYGIDYPKTVIYSKGDELDIPFDYPVIIKPSSSVLYWKYPFDGMNKVYRARSYDDAKKIIDQIYASGYPEKLIIQDMIPGDDSKMYTLTCYSDKDANVRMMCLGHVLLEEHTPKGHGNHCAIITEQNDELCTKIKAFLEGIRYTGFSNFDIKFDTRDNTYRVFEINCRQGRSNYYVTASGCSVAKAIVEDKIENKPFEGTNINNNIIYWRYIPDSIVRKYSDDKIKALITDLKSSKKAFSSMRYRYDIRFNIKHWIYVTMHEIRQIKKFKTYYHPEKQ